MDALDAILTRRSIRRFTGEPLGTETIEALLRAAMAAPSAGNQQPWRFIVATTREAIDAIAASTPYGHIAAGAPVAIVVCADTRDLKHPMMWQQDTSAATQNLLIAANALGLGACWLGFWPKMERVEPLKQAAGLPEGVEPLAVIAVGHPQEEKPAAERFDSDKIRHERWS